MKRDQFSVVYLVPIYLTNTHHCQIDEIHYSSEREQALFIIKKDFLIRLKLADLMEVLLLSFV